MGIDNDDGRDSDNDTPQKTGGEVVQLFGDKPKAPKASKVAAEPPEPSTQEELLGTVDDYFAARIKGTRNPDNRDLLRERSAEFSRRMALAVFCAEGMGYAPVLPETNGPASRRLAQMQRDLRDPKDLETMARYLHGNGRGVLLVGSHMLSAVDPLSSSPLQMGFMTGIVQVDQAVWRVRLRVSDDVYRVEGGKYRPSKRRDVELLLDTKKGRKSASWPDQCELQNPRGILFLK